MRLSVVVASGGRDHLVKTVLGITQQLMPGDELLVDVNDDAPWGHAARQRMQARAAGDFVVFMDDDDRYTDNGLEIIRWGVATDPDRVHIFRMMYPNGHVLWRDPEVRCGNVSTQMVAVPRRFLGVWGARYEGDFDFIVDSVRRSGGDPVWHTEIVCLVGHN